MTGHTGAILDIKWNPFNDNIIASASDDASVKLWYIPDGGLTANLTECLVQLTGHKRRVGFVEWHPTADNILASVGFDYTVRFSSKKIKSFFFFAIQYLIAYIFYFNADSTIF